MIRLTHPTLAAPLELGPITVLEGAGGAARAAQAIHALARGLTWDVSAALAGLPAAVGGPGRSPSLEHPELDARIARAVAAMTAALSGGPELPELGFAFGRQELAGGLGGEAILRDGDAALAISAADLADGCAHEVALRLRRDEGSILADLRDHRGRGRLSGRLLLARAHGPSEAWAAELTRVVRELVRWIAGTVLYLPQDRRALACSYRSLAPEQARLSPPGAVSFVSMLRAAETVGSDTSDGIEPGLRRALADRAIRGHVGFTRVEGGAPLSWSPADGVQIPLHEAPPLVGTLAGLDVYVRHFAAPGDVLVVEEPELALDAAARRVVAEVLARLAASRIRVVVVTASGRIVEDLLETADCARLPLVLHAFRREAEMEREPR